MTIKAYIEEEKREITVWKLQIGKDCYFVQEFPKQQHEETKEYTVSFLIIR